MGCPLLDTVAVIERVAGGRDVDALVDSVFALDVLGAAGGGAEVVGRVLDFLRARSGANHVAFAVAAPEATIDEAVASYESGALALMARGTQHPMTAHRGAT